jgi:hypothetical protein
MPPPDCLNRHALYPPGEDGCPASNGSPYVADTSAAVVSEHATVLAAPPAGGAGTLVAAAPGAVAGVDAASALAPELAGGLAPAGLAPG